MRIEYVTHASLFFRHGEDSLLTDPFYWFDPISAQVMLHFPPRPLAPEDLGPIPYLYSSHIHPDHSHPETLVRLKDQVRTVLLPANRPALEARYRTLGFSDIRLLSQGVPHVLSDRLTVTSYWSDPIDSCLVVEADGTTAIHLNDCLPSFELAGQIGERHRIDYAFMLYTSAQDLFPFLLPHPEAERQALAEKRERDFLEGQLHRIELLKPRVVVPYSMTMTYFQPEQQHLNGYHRLLPPLFAEAVRERFPESRTLVVKPGDVIDTASDTVTSSTDTAWGDTLDQFLANIAAYAQARRDLPRFHAGSVQAVADRLQSRLHAFGRQPRPAALTDVHRVLERGVDLEVVGEDGRRTFHVGGRPAVLHIEVPASIVASMLDGHYDPYSLLFLHRTRFRLEPAIRIPPEAESSLYILAFMLLLAENPLQFVAVA